MNDSILKRLSVTLGVVALLAALVGTPGAMWWDAQRFAVYEERGQLIVRMPVTGTLEIPKVGTCERCTLTFAVYTRGIDNPANQELVIIGPLPFASRRVTSVERLYERRNGATATVWWNYRLTTAGKRIFDLMDEEKRELDGVLLRALTESERYLAQRELFERAPRS